MKRIFSVMTVGLTVFATLSNVAFAGQWDNVPLSGRPRSFQPLARDATTGSIQGRVGRDLIGRDMRSSTRGNAEFPARPPEAQSLGGTAGGPRY